MQLETPTGTVVPDLQSPEHRTIGRELRDGYEVHRAALERGFDVRLLPRQVMEVSDPEDPSKTVAFTHGVPEGTTLAGATYTQDLRMRRAILTKAGFAVPRGATFSVGRSQSLALKFASRIGYPVVLKPAVGDNTIEVAPGLENRDELTKAIEYLYTPPSQREKFTRAAYALTELREPGRVNGKVVAPPGYRFLIEKHVQGQYLRFLVVGQEVHNILHCPGGPWASLRDQIQDVTATTHVSLKDIAVGAARAVPGLSIAAVDIIVPDFRADTTVEEAQIVELSERPWLSVQHLYSPELASGLAGAIMRSGLPHATDATPQETISSEVLVGGAVDPAKLLEVLRVEFATLEIDGELYESDHVLGQLRGTVSGPPGNIAWMMEQLLDEGIDGQRVMMVEQKSKL